MARAKKLSDYLGELKIDQKYLVKYFCKSWKPQKMIITVGYLSS